MRSFERKYENMKMFGFGYETMKNIKICKKCGKPANANRLVCKNCGTLLSAKTLFDFYKKKHTVCHNCNIFLPDNSHFCPGCGAVNKGRKKFFKEGNGEKSEKNIF